MPVAIGTRDGWGRPTSSMYRAYPVAPGTDDHENRGLEVVWPPSGEEVTGAARAVAAPPVRRHRERRIDGGRFRHRGGLAPVLVGAVRRRDRHDRPPVGVMIDEPHQQEDVGGARPGPGRRGPANCPGCRGPSIHKRDCPARATSRTPACTRSRSRRRPAWSGAAISTSPIAEIGPASRRRRPPDPPPVIGPVNQRDGGGVGRACQVDGRRHLDGDERRSSH